MIECTVGVMAYNEAANLGRLLQRLLRQRLHTVVIRRIVVVASGCTDDTPQVARRVAAQEPRVQLILQEQRRGKASAINAFLPHAVGKVVALESADTVPAPDAIEQLVRPFADRRVGMTGGRPIPINEPERFWGHAAHLLWGLHHDISLKQPKLGELVAFRNVLTSIPEDTAVDEASIQAAMAGRSLETRYVPQAVVYNVGPATVGDFLRQRRRIHAGHLHLSDTTGYQLPTMGISTILPALIRRLQPSPRKLLFTAAVVMLEAWARALAVYDYRIRRRNPFVWDTARTTKVLRPSRSSATAGEGDVAR